MIAGPVCFSVRHNPCHSHSHCQTPTIFSLLVSTFSPELAEATTAPTKHTTSMNRRVNMIDPPVGNCQTAEPMILQLLAHVTLRLSCRVRQAGLVRNTKTKRNSAFPR